MTRFSENNLLPLYYTSTLKVINFDQKNNLNNTIFVYRKGTKDQFKQHDDNL